VAGQYDGEDEEFFTDYDGENDNEQRYRHQALLAAETSATAVPDALFIRMPRCWHRAANPMPLSLLRAG
jgi:hypothetical protein